MEATECGAACLSMVLAFHSYHAPLAEVRVACGVSREGSKASDLLRAARAFGLSAKGWRANLSGISEVSLPAILFWNSNHFVVLEGWDNERQWFWINDPAFGHRRIDETEFSRSFSGIVLTFSPGPEFHSRPAPPGIFRWILGKTAQEPLATVFVALAAIILTIPSLAVPVFMRVFVDDYYINKEYEWLWPLLAGMSLATIAQIGLTISIRRVLLRWEIRQAERDSQTLLDQLQHLPLLDRLARGPTELAARLALPAENARLIFRQFGGWLAYLPTAIASVIWMSLCGWKLSALLFILVLGTAITLWLIHQIQQERQAEIAMRRIQFENAVVRGLSLLDTFKFGNQTGFLHQLATWRERIFSGEQRIAIWQLNGHIASRLLAAFAFSGILAVGAVEVMAGHLAPGSLIAFLVLWLPLSGWLMQMFPLNRALRNLALNRERLADLPPTAVVAAVDKPTVFESLEMRAVTFGYSRAAPAILKDLSLNIGPGQRIALIGESGSGKSTLARLLIGLLKANTGDILLNGSATSPERFAQCAAWAESESVLLAGTALDHLRLGNETLSSDQAAEALRVVGISPELASRPLADDGNNISSGERQRLEMARLFARSPRLLVLDEATNAIETASHLAWANEWQRRGCAWLWITHSSEIARQCDEIWVLVDGKIAARGTWEELAVTSEHFRQLMGS